FGVEPGSLFAVQFMWQFPHFWAIAWVAHDDYLKAGYELLPFRSGKSKRASFQILLYSLFLIPVSLLPWFVPIQNPMVGNIAMVVTVLCGIVFALLAWKLHRSNDMKDAKILMFASFIYLPIVQLIYVIDKC
ncbi:MAG: UbiA family prenyltransferase, partial [Bacteroidota bacterium]